MLFVLDESLLKFDPISEVHSRAIETLLSAFQNNYHVLFMEMRTLREFDKKFSNSLSFNGRKALSALNNRLPSYKSELNGIKKRVLVFIGDDNANIASRDEMGWKVPLSHFSLGLLQTALIGENDRDAEFYNFLADRYRVLNKINGFSVASRPRGGGGSGIVEVIESYLKTEISPCLCITDSDKYHPECGASTTVKKCEEISLTATRVIDYVCIEEREVENFIPLAILEKASPQYTRFINELSKIRGFDDAIWPYLDLKKGISLSWILKRDTPTQKFWADFKKHLEARQRVCTRCRGNSDDDNEECSCSTIPGLGEKTLDNTLKYIRDTASRVTDHLLDADRTWSDLGKTVMDYLIAPRGERSRSAIIVKDIK